MNAFGGMAFGGRVGEMFEAMAGRPKRIKVTRPTIVLDRLGRKWDGLRIAHLSDLHHGPLAGLPFMLRVVELTNAQEPDLVVITGDTVTCEGGINVEMAAVLAQLKAPLGVYAVLGNHDHWSDGPGVKRMLNSVGINVVDNRHVLLSRKGQKLAIAGVGDLWSDIQDLPKALKGVPPSAARILLCHNPRYAKQMPARPRVDLMLAGHTHGKHKFRNKIRLALNRTLDAEGKRPSAGLLNGKHCQVYISSGIGTVGLPIRVAGRAELPIITLRRGTA